MKILIVSQYFWPENFRINDLATELASRGHEVTILTGLPNYPEGCIFEDFRKRPNDYANFGNVKIVRVPLAARRKGGLRLIINYFSFMLSASLIGPLKLVGKKFDAIFVYEPSPITVGIPAIVLKYLKKAPIAFWVLDLWPETLAAVGAVKSKPILRAVGWLVRFIYSQCDLILGQSESFLGAIAKYCKCTDKIRYFPSWSEELPHHNSVDAAPEVKAVTGMFTVLFAGNIGEAQDFPTILDAADMLRERRDIRWVIVGDGRMAKWVSEQIGARNLYGQVILAGRFPLERMPSFFKHADALLVTLKAQEVFAMTIPGKIQTYLSSGLPLLGALDGEGADVVAKAGAGYTCRAGDASGLAEAVRKMADLNADERTAMGRAGQVYYATHFEKNLLIDMLESDLDRLTAAQD